MGGVTETLLFALAALCLLGALVLWWIDARRRRHAQAELTDPIDEADAWDTPAAELEPEPETEPGLDPEAELDSGEEPVDVTARALSEDGFEEVAEVQDPEPEAPATPRPAARSRFGMPGSARRERRAWAQDKGWSYARTDPSVSELWYRGAAAEGAAAREVVSGSVDGVSLHVADLAAVTVVAVARPSSSEVVVDIRRTEFDQEFGGQEDSDDLVAVDAAVDLEGVGFHCYATNPQAADRFLDERVRDALARLPQAVDAVWLESEWVIAQLDRGSRAADWEDTIAPLRALADAARVLPPTPGTEKPLDTSQLDASRALPEQGSAGKQEGAPVRRPDKPVPLPSRARNEAHGGQVAGAPGDDEVEPIGHGEEDGSDDAQGTRAVRRDQKPSSIFEDLTNKLGHDPLEDSSLDLGFRIEDEPEH